MHSALSACATWAESASASEYTATDPRPRLRRLRMMRQAMAPRLAISTLSKPGGEGMGVGAFSRGGGVQTVLGAGGGVRVEEYDRRRLVGIARVVQLWAVREQHPDIHLGAKFDILSGAGHSVGKLQPALRRDRNVHEEIDVRHQVPLAQTDAGIGDGQ